MATTARAPRLEFARRGANPTLESIEYVRSILKNAEEPLSRNNILRVLSDWAHSMSRQSLNAVIGFLAADGSVAEGSKGIIWVPEASPEILAAIEGAQPL